MTTTTGSMPVAARAASRHSTRARRSHAVEIAQGVLIAAFFASVVALLLATRPPARSQVDLARGAARAAPALAS